MPPADLTGIHSPIASATTKTIFTELTPLLNYADRVKASLPGFGVEPVVIGAEHEDAFLQLDRHAVDPASKLQSVASQLLVPLAPPVLLGRQLGREFPGPVVAGRGGVKCGRQRPANG